MPRRDAPPTAFAGRYQLEQELGRGGFGIVHRAWDLEAQRRVALKLVDKRSLELAGGMHRFHREASVLMRLTHPSVVRAYDAGEWNGTPYLVLELLHGESLDTALRTRGALPIERVAAITRDLLGALGEAHALGVVHRDVKPANVFLCADEGGERTKLLDFGIAKADGIDAAQTAMGATLGTAAYMAPEQVTGGKVQPATDLFAVGLLISEMITGRRIYGGTSGLAILVAKANGDAVEIPQPVRDSPLGPLVARAVQIDPDRRFASADEMRMLLDRATPAPRPSGEPRPPLASAPPRDSPLPPMGARPTEIGETALHVGLSESPSDAPRRVPSGDFSSAAPGPTQIREIESAETASFDPLPGDGGSGAQPAKTAPTLGVPIATKPARRRAVVVAIVAGLVLAGGAAGAWAYWGRGSKKGRAPARTTEVIDRKKPIVLKEGDTQLILPGDEPVTSKDGSVQLGAGKLPDRAEVACPLLATMSLDEIEARLRGLGKVTLNHRGTKISCFTIPDPQDDPTDPDGADLDVIELESIEMAREVARRLRRAGPILSGGKKVVTVESDALLPSVQTALCRAEKKP